MSEQDFIDIKDYNKIDKIGSGSFGDVYKVQDKNTGEIFAAKVSNKTYDDLKGSNEIKNLLREVDHISKIKHPSIIKFIGFSLSDFYDENKPVIVTEYLPNGSLEDIIKLERSPNPDPNWTPTRKLISIYGIAASMSFLHFHDILHRDLKPGNILLDEFLFPKIADFGLSKDESIVTSTVEIKGTPIYIAPEIWEDNHYSKASDVYAFAFVVYQIITSETPFKGCNLYQVQNKVCKGIRPPITKVPSEAYRLLIESCWDKDPDSRPSFDEIRSKLKKTPEFITSDIIEEDYRYYCKTLDRSRKIYDSKKVTFDRNTITFRPVSLDKKRLLPIAKYNKLSESCKKLVDEASCNPDMQFKVGKNLIEGLKRFPKDIDIGIQYLKSSIEGLNVDAAIYYNKMLISGKVIPQNLKEAKNNLKKYKIQNNQEIKLLIGIIDRKEENYAEAIDIFYDLATEYDNAEASYQLGKMLYRGEGTDLDKKEANKYFEKAKEDGCKKIANFLSKSKKAKKQDDRKRVDIVFLIDGSATMSLIYNSFRNIFQTFVEKCQEEYPDTLFRFGAVMYKSEPLTNKMFKQSTTSLKHKKLVFNDLTDDLDEIQNFFITNKVCGGALKRPADWSSGYACICKKNKMHWNEKAQKIVIHLCNSPSLGKSFTMDPDLPRSLIKLPKFDNDLGQNKEIYTKIQSTEDKNFKKNIQEIAELNPMFSCLNFNDLALYSFKKVRDLFMENGGKRFIVEDQFEFNPNESTSISDINKDELAKKIKKFLINSINALVDDDIGRHFETRSNNKFEKDLKKFKNENTPQKKPFTTKPKKPKIQIRQKKTIISDYFDDDKKTAKSSNDDDDDFDNDDDDGFVKEEEEIVHKRKKSETEIKRSKKMRADSTPSIPEIQLDDDDEDEDDEFTKKDEKSTLKNKKRPKTTSSIPEMKLDDKEEDEDDDGFTKKEEEIVHKRKKSETENKKTKKMRADTTPSISNDDDDDDNEINFNEAIYGVAKKKKKKPRNPFDFE